MQTIFFINTFQYFKYLWWRPVKNKILIVWIMFLLSVIPMCIPLILKWEYATDNIAFAINNSIIYKLLNMLLVGLSLPLLTEALLDYYEKTSDLVDILERIANVFYFGFIPFIMVALSLTSTLTSLNFWFLFYLQRFFLVATFVHNLVCVESTTLMISHTHILFCYLVFCVSQTLRFYEPNVNTIPFELLNVALFYIALIMTLISTVIWGMTLYKVLKSEQWRKLSYSEYKTVVLFVGFLFYIIGMTIVANVYDASTDNFSNQYTGQYLCVSASVVILHALIVTILPGRASRRMVEKEREMLTIKREFVKSISNEITSPLCVSHLSLEVLKSQIKGDREMQVEQLLVHVENIYSANETALSIMNDLLQYENIDTGTFKLTKKVVAMKNVFKGRFKPLQYLAQKYQVNLMVFDEVGASEYYKEVGDSFGNANNNLNLFNAVDLSTDFSKYTLSVDIISIDQMLRNIMYTMVKNTPLGGTVTLKFTTRKSERQNNNTKINNSNNNIEKHYLTIEFSYISVLDESQEARDFHVVIFDPNKPLNEGDSGMDLWIANKIVDAHDGKIDFHCDANRRNPRFLVNLPLVLNEVEELNINISTTDFARTPSDTGTKNSGRSSSDTRSSYRISDLLLQDSNRRESRSISNNYKKIYIESDLENQNGPNEIDQNNNDGYYEDKVKFLKDVFEDKSNSMASRGHLLQDLEVGESQVFAIKGKDKPPVNSYNIYSKAHSLFPLQTIPTKFIITTDIQQSEFSLVSFLVSGSCSDIFTAVYQDKQVIVKMVKAELQNSQHALNELKSEVEILTRCNHKNLIRIYGTGKTPRPFIVIEYLEGGTLSDKLSILDSTDDNNSNYRDDHHTQMIEYALIIAKTMRYLHSELYEGLTIIHRDLKPENIGFTADGIIKIFDFGLASTVLNKQNSSDVYQLTGFTGSIRYMAPEVALKQPYSEKVDVYSFGVLLWQMITLQQPYAYANNNVVIGRVVLNGERPIITTEFPKYLRDLLAQCWNKDAENRPCFGNIVKQLEEILH